MAKRYVGTMGGKGSGKDTVGEALIAEHGFVRIALADEIKRIAQRLFQLPDQKFWFGESQFREVPFMDQILERGMTFEERLVGVIWRAERELQNNVRLFGASNAVAATRALCALIDQDFRTQGYKLNARYVLQRMGTEWGRTVDQNVWVRCVSDAAALLSEQTDYAPAVGLRYRSEPCAAAPTSIVVTDVRFENEVRFIHAEGGRVWAVDPGARVPEPETPEHPSEPRFATMLSWGAKRFDNTGPKAALGKTVREMLAE